MPNKLFLFLSLLVGPMLLLKGQDHIKLTRFDKAPVIDGIASDDSWESCQAITRFIQREPRNGEAFHGKN